MLRASVAPLGVVVLGVGLVGCTPSSLSASREVDGAFADGAGPGRLLADASHDANQPYYDAALPQTPADAGVNCPHVSSGGSDPRSYCAVRCRSTSPASDVQVWLDQTSVPQNVGADGPVPSFLVRILQTVPTPCDQTFTNIQTLWSGDFMNFSGQNGQWQFHLLPTESIASAFYGDASGSGAGDQNVEVYPLLAVSNSGPVDVESRALICLIFTN